MANQLTHQLTFQILFCLSLNSVSCSWLVLNSQLGFEFFSGKVLLSNMVLSRFHAWYIIFQKYFDPIVLCLLLLLLASLRSLICHSLCTKLPGIAYSKAQQSFAEGCQQTEYCQKTTLCIPIAMQDYRYTICFDKTNVFQMHIYESMYYNHFLYILCLLLFCTQGIFSFVFEVIKTVIENLKKPPSSLYQPKNL